MTDKFDLAERLASRVMAGKEGAVAVATMDDGTLQAMMGNEHLGVIRLELALTTGGQEVKLDERNFCGRLLMDDHGKEDSCPARFVLLDALGKILLSSEDTPLMGRILLITATKSKIPFAYASLLDLQAPSPRSAVYWNCSQDFVSYLTLQEQLFTGEILPEGTVMPRGRVV